MILFLDFDGVLHPQYADRALPDGMAFCHLPRFEAVMREHPAVDIVISSMWRYTHSVEELRRRFSAGMRARIVGTTPLNVYDDGPYVLAAREKEVLQWLEENGRQDEDWLALDDMAWPFRRHRQRVVECVTCRGFDEEAAAALRIRLRPYAAV